MVCTLTCGRRTVMARGAVATDTRMVEVRGHPATDGMAAIALKCGGHMASRFTCLSHAVMAGGAAANRIAMVILRWSPAVVVMARITTAGGQDMVCRFTRCSGVIVTGDAGSHCCRVVHSQRWPPAAGVMTLSTVITGGDVFGMFSTGINKRTCTVTAAAAARCPLEDTVTMATGAVDTGMGAIEGETSGEVVELLHILLGVGQRCAEERG